MDDLGHEIMRRIAELIPPERREIGMVFQEHTLFPHLNAQNVAFGLRGCKAVEVRATVSEMLELESVDRLPNVVFIDSQEYISSYELIQRAGFVIVYNSSIGMEASLMGKAVVCGGNARYTQYPMVYFPQSPEALREQCRGFPRCAGYQAIP